MAEDNKQTELKLPAGMDGEELSDEVKQFLLAQQAKLESYEKQSEESKSQLEEMEQKQEERDGALKEQMKAKGDYRELAQATQIELDAAKERIKDLEKTKKNVKAMADERIAELPEHFQAVLKDMDSEAALRHYDLFKQEATSPQAPDIAGGQTTGNPQVRKYRLSEHEQQVVDLLGIPPQEYRESKHKMETKEIF